MRSPDVPVRIRSGVVQIHIRRTAVRAIVAITADKGAKRAKQKQGAHHIPIYSHFPDCYFIIGDSSPIPLRSLCCGRLFARKRSPDVPVRTRSGAVQTHRRRTAVRATAATTADKGDCDNLQVYPVVVTCVCAAASTDCLRESAPLCHVVVFLPSSCCCCINASVNEVCACQVVWR